MQLSAIGRAFIQKWEGFVPRVYRDIAGIGTVCWGHVITHEDGRTFDDGASLEACEDVFGRDIGLAESAIDGLVKVSLSPHQNDALCSFVFNTGSGALRTSTLLVRLNQGDYDSVPAELLKWCKYKDPKTGELRENLGLKARRQSEGELWGAKDAGEAAPIAEGEITDEQKQSILSLVLLTSGDLASEAENLGTISTEPPPPPTPEGVA